jgi:hypothetical protein
LGAFAFGPALLAIALQVTAKWLGGQGWFRVTGTATAIASVILLYLYYSDATPPPSGPRYAIVSLFVSGFWFALFESLIVIAIAPIRLINDWLKVSDAAQQQRYQAAQRERYE